MKKPWVQPKAANGTPMDAAFREATRLVQGWLGDGFPTRNDCFPPVVINISDGAPNDEKAALAEAQALQNTGTSDGTTLVFNVHITDTPTQEVVFPETDSVLPDSYGRLLFGMSSVLPDSIKAQAVSAGLPTQPLSRGIVYGASIGTLVKVLNFGSVSFR